MKGNSCIIFALMLAFGAQLWADCWMWKKQNVAIPPGLDDISNIFFDENAGAIAAVIDDSSSVALWHYYGSGWQKDWESQPESINDYSSYRHTRFVFFEATTRNIMIVGQLWCGLECGFNAIYKYVPFRGWVPVSGAMQWDLDLALAPLLYSYDSANNKLVMLGFWKFISGDPVEVTVEFNGSEFSVFIDPHIYNFIWENHCCPVINRVISVG